MLRQVAFWSTKKQMRSGNITGSKADQTPSTGSRELGKTGTYVLTGVLGVIVILSAWYYYVGTRKIPSAGGLYFFSKLVLPVERFAQDDPRWADDELGPAPATMGEEGCAVSSAAMVLAFYGQDIDPGRLNAFLSISGGYTPQGWLYWEKAADYHPGVARHAYEDLPSYFLIDSNLERGNPVIVRIRLPNGVTHFVVIVGKSGFDYLIQDPASGGANGVYPLRKLAPGIEALRFYEKLTAFPLTARDASGR
jgi:Peptidase_C39 like family